MPPAPEEDELLETPPAPETAAVAPPLPTTLPPPAPGSGEPVPPTPLLVPAVDVDGALLEPALPSPTGVVPPQAAANMRAASAVIG
jgi:hypothetical protein